MALREYPLVVIGAGAGGLVVAIGAAKAGKRVLLVEAGNYGGDCTNFGCIPSKSLIASAHVAHSLRQTEEFGLSLSSFQLKADGALERVRRIVAEVKSHEVPDALEQLNVETLTGKASFIDKKTIEVTKSEGEADHIRAKTFVIATGSHPFIPEIPGLAEIPYLTNETLFSLEVIPEHLMVLGGGPIGCEMSQAFRRLGSRVTLIGTRPVLLPRDEPEAQRVLQEQFEKEGIELFLGYQTEKVAREEGGKIALTIRPTKGEEQTTLYSSHLLLSVGRRPNIRELNLDAAGIKYSSKGIDVDSYGRTSQKNIWCIGDASGAPFYTHMAEAQGRAVLTSLLLPSFFRRKIDRSQNVPHVTFTDPEVARLGPTELELESRYLQSKLAVYYVPFSEVDRAITTNETAGFVKMITKKWSGQILGATVVGSRAGEMLCQIATAAKGKIPVRKIASVIHPYPTFSLAIRKAADKYLTETILPALRKRRTFYWKRWVPLLIILVLMIISYFSGIAEAFDFQTLKEHRIFLKELVSTHPILAPLAYILLYICITALSIPGAVFVTMAGGFLFSQPWSTLYTVIGATIGAACLFLAARTALADTLREKAGPRLMRMKKGFEENAASYLLFLRLIPLFPFWLVNLAPAIFGIPLLTFIWTTFLGIIPGTFVYTQAGAGIGSILDAGETFQIQNVFTKDVAIALTALAIFSLLPILYKKFRRKNSAQ